MPSSEEENFDRMSRITKGIKRSLNMAKKTISNDCKQIVEKHLLIKKDNITLSDLCDDLINITNVRVILGDGILFSLFIKKNYLYLFYFIFLFFIFLFIYFFFIFFYFFILSYFYF